MNDLKILNNLSFSRFKGYFRVSGGKPVHLPPYTGSTFRGALGHANFLTPFRFRNQNRFGDEPTFKIFMRNVFRRITLLAVHSSTAYTIDYHGLLQKAESIERDSRLKWFDWQRYSNRQGKWMNMGGFVGDIVFSGDLYEFLPYIKMCEFLNVGKGGSFGLGEFEAFCSRA